MRNATGTIGHRGVPLDDRCRPLIFIHIVYIGLPFEMIPEIHQVVMTQGGLRAVLRCTADLYAPGLYIIGSIIDKIPPVHDIAVDDIARDPAQPGVRPIRGTEIKMVVPHRHQPVETAGLQALLGLADKDVCVNEDCHRLFFTGNYARVEVKRIAVSDQAIENPILSCINIDLRLGKTQAFHAVHIFGDFLDIKSDIANTPPKLQLLAAKIDDILHSLCAQVLHIHILKRVIPRVNVFNKVNRHLMALVFLCGRNGLMDGHLGHGIQIRKLASVQTDLLAVDINGLRGVFGQIGAVPEALSAGPAVASESLSFRVVLKPVYKDMVDLKPFLSEFHNPFNGVPVLFRRL